MLLPEVETDQHHRRRAGTLLVRQESSSRQRRNAHDLDEVGRHAVAANVHRSSRARRTPLVGPSIAIASIVADSLAQGLEDRSRDAHAGACSLLSEDLHQPVRVLERQGPQHDRVHKAEQRRRPPMPSARIATASAANHGDRASVRKVNRRSSQRSVMDDQDGKTARSVGKLAFLPGGGRMCASGAAGESLCRWLEKLRGRERPAREPREVNGSLEVEHLVDPHADRRMTRDREARAATSPAPSRTPST